MLTGFYITCSTYYDILLTGTSNNVNNYEVNISVTSDTVVHRVDFYVLIVEDYAIGSRYYYVVGQSIIGSTAATVNSASWTTTVDNYDKTEFLLAVRGFGGFVALSNI